MGRHIRGCIYALTTRIILCRLCPVEFLGNTVCSPKTLKILMHIFP